MEVYLKMNDAPILSLNLLRDISLINQPLCLKSVGPTTLRRHPDWVPKEGVLAGRDSCVEIRKFIKTTKLRTSQALILHCFRLTLT
jgi:hypothetical protein